MKVSEFRSVGALVLVGLLVAMSSCAHDQQLVAISVVPQGAIFGDANTPVPADASLSRQLRALGTYIHPPVTKDITDQVTWASDSPGIVGVNSTGLITPAGVDCGISLVSATVTTNHSAGDRPSSGAIVTGFMNATVVCFTGTGGGSGPVLTAQFAGPGTGSITSSPAGLTCATTCSASFASGTMVTITAVPNGTFGGWGNCDTTSGPNLTVCTINSLTANRTITATFN